jgi:Transposase DDE domain group 1
VKEIVRRKLWSEKRGIERRLEGAVRVNDGGPVLRAGNIDYEIAEKTRGIAHGGIGMIQRVVQKVGLAPRIDAALNLLKIHKPYHESDHVLNIAYNALFGGQRLEDIELRRNDRVLLDALGTVSLPDPTTAGDFCRRFDGESIDALMDAINETRMKVWARQPESFRAETARIDADGSIVPTTGECKEGMDIAYNGIWGYSALLVSLANTHEVLYLANHGANRPSHEGVIGLFDRAIALCRRGGFQDILLRGDTDFSITTEFDRWSGAGVRFVFGYDARANMVERAGNAPDSVYRDLERRAEREILTRPRTRPENVKDRIVWERKYKTIRPKSEELFEFEYTPVKCHNSYRVVALRKNLSVEKGEEVLFDEIRYFFYITNDRVMNADQVVNEARQRCNQENLIAQLKSGGVRALHAPVNTLHANWAYMVMAALAWNLKAWVALLLPVHPRWAAMHLEQRRRLLSMDFRTFVAALIHIPCQIVKAARRIRYRLLAWNEWQLALFRLLDAV